MQLLLVPWSKVFALAAIVLFVSAVAPRAAELVMLEQAGCSWCRTFDREVGEIYHKTPEGRIAPLRRVDIHGQLPDDLKGLSLGRFTPTFVLMHDGEEVGRITGYPGEDFFWGLFGKLLEKLPDGVAQSS